MPSPSHGDPSASGSLSPQADGQRDLHSWLQADPDRRALTSARGKMLCASALLPQANSVSLTITAQADLVRLLEEGEYNGHHIAAWENATAREVSWEHGTWNVLGPVPVAKPRAPSPETVRESAPVHTPVERALRWARQKIMGSSPLPEWRARLIPLSVADLADQVIALTEQVSLRDDETGQGLAVRRQAFPVRTTRSAPGLLSPEPLDAGGRLSSWRAGQAMAAAQDALEECALVFAERWGERVLISDDRLVMASAAAPEIGAVTFGHPDAHKLGDWLEVTASELAGGAGQLVVLGYRPGEAQPWRVITAQQGAVEIMDISVTPPGGSGDRHSRT